MLCVCTGELIPGGDPAWYTKMNSPYYRQSHIAWRNRLRKFVDEKILPRTDEMRNLKVPPADIVLALGEEGFLAAMCGKTKQALKYLPREVQAKIPDDFDFFHELITIDEIARCGDSPIVAGLTNGPAIALSAIMSFGTEVQKQIYVADVLLGKKCMALAISEPNAGSDVAGLLCSATKTPDGSHYVVNGNKKWITNGLYADFFVTAVVTDPSAHGHKGLSLLIIPATAG
jgi:alkylation response protein AidB-like acyl-CoA dehydrogenase